MTVTIKYCAVNPILNTALLVDTYVGNDWDGFVADYKEFDSSLELININNSDFPTGHNWSQINDTLFKSYADFDTNNQVTLQSNIKLAIEQVLVTSRAKKEDRKISFMGKDFYHTKAFTDSIINLAMVELNPDTSGVLPVLLLAADYTTVTIADKSTLMVFVDIITKKDVEWSNSTIAEITKLKAMNTIAELVVYTDNRIY